MSKYLRNGNKEDRERDGTITPRWILRLYVFEEERWMKLV
jgi:hypothetical protein